MSNIDDIDKAFHASDASPSRIPAPKWVQRLAIGFVIALILIILMKPTCVMHISCSPSTPTPSLTTPSPTTPSPSTPCQCAPTMTLGKIQTLKYALIAAPFLYPIIQKWY